MGNRSSQSTPEPDYPSISWEEAKTKIQPFDVLLFRGGDFISSTISKIQKLKLRNGAFSHAGIVMNGDLLGFSENKLYIWEITMSGKLNDGVPDIRGKSFLGVQVRDLESVIRATNQNKNCRVAWLAVKNNPYSQVDPVEVRVEVEPEVKVRIETPVLRPNFLKQKVQKLYLTTLETPYEVYCCNLISATFPKLRCISVHQNKRFFCSEFVAYVLKEVGILPQTIVEGNVVPVDFIPGVDEDKEITCCESPIYLL